MKRDELRAMIDNHELWKNDGADGYNVAADHLADELSKLFPPMPEPVHYTYRDCDADRLTRTLDQTKPTEEVVTVIVGQYGWNDREGKRGDGYRIILKCTECRHDWESGWGMGAPTRTCKKCGKFEND